jgi:hypothetical protein
MVAGRWGEWPAIILFTFSQTQTPPQTLTGGQNLAETKQ